MITFTSSGVHDGTLAPWGKLVAVCEPGARYHPDMKLTPMREAVLEARVRYTMAKLDEFAQMVAERMASTREACFETLSTSWR